MSDEAEQPMQSPLIPIITSIRRGHSGKGMSYYTKGAKCPRLLQLDQQRPEIEPDFVDMSALSKGTILHALLEAYHTNGGRVVELDALGFEQSLAMEVQDWFKWYVQNFPTTFWGPIYGVELQFPRNDADKSVLTEWLGVPEFTFRPDMLVELGDSDIERLQEHFIGLILNGPGLYVLDWKSAAAKAQYDELAYGQSLQFIAYQSALQKLGFNVRGMMAVKCILHKRPELYMSPKDGGPPQNHSVQAYFSMPPTQEQHRMVADFVQWAAKEIATGEPRPHICVAGSSQRPCHHLMAGTCTRTK